MKRTRKKSRTIIGLGFVFLFIFIIFGSAHANNITIGFDITLTATGTISGLIHFSGVKTGAIHIGVFDNADFLGEPAGGTVIPLDAASPVDIPYTIENLSVGSYFVGAFLDLKLPGNVGGEPDPNEPLTYFGDMQTGPQPVIVSDAPPFAEGIDLYLTYGDHISGAISGRVTEIDGLTPISGITVQASNFWDWMWGGSAVTDQDGYYSISGLVKGPYRVWTSSPPESYWIDEFYNDATVSWQAAEVIVSGQQPVSGIDFALDAGARVHGLVYARNAAGSLIPATEVHINVSGFSSADGSWLEFDLPDFSINKENPGNYLIKIPPGEWTIQAAPYPGGAFAAYAPAETFVNIGSANIDLQADDMILELGTAISGRVVNELGQGMPNVSVFFVGGMHFWTKAHSDANGNYFLQGIPQGNSGWIQARPDITTGFAWSAEIPVFNAPGQPLAGLDLVVKPGVKVIGDTVNPAQEPIPFQEFWYGSKMTNGWGMSDGTGYFEFRLPVGKHWINFDGQQEMYGALPVEVNVSETDLALPNLGPVYLVLHSQSTGGAISGALSTTGSPASGGQFFIVAFPAGTAVNPVTIYGLNPTQETDFFGINGSFELFPLPPGTNYDVYLGLLWGNGDGDMFSFVSLEARYNVPIGTTDLTFQHDTPGITVDGSVTDGLRNVPGAQVLIIIMPAPGNANAGKGFGLTQIRPDGTFILFDMVPGEYIAQATHPLYFDSPPLPISLLAGQTAFTLSEPLVLESMNKNPVIRAADVWADNTPTGVSYVFWARVEDPDGIVPGSITSVVARGPQGDEVILPYDPNFRQYIKVVTSAPSAGIYAFTATDVDGHSGSLTSEFQGPPAEPLAVVTIMRPMNGALVNPVPVFSWQRIKGSQGYRVRISDAAGMVIFNSDIQEGTFFSMPVGILQPGQSYKWRLEAYDAPFIPEVNSRSRSGWVTINTEQIPQVPVIDMADVWGVNKADGFIYRPWARVIPNGSLPDNTVVTATGPDQVVRVLTGYQKFLEVFSLDVASPLPAGAYTFEITDAEGLKAGFIANFRLPITLPVATGLTPIEGTVVPLNPQFSWQAAAGAIAYRVRIAVADQVVQGKQTFFSSPLSAETFFQLPLTALPILEPGKEYFWRVDAHDAASIPGTNSVSMTPWIRIITEGTPVVALRGDLNGDEVIGLADAVIALQVMSGKHPQMVQNLLSQIEVNGDSRIGIQEAIFALQAAAHLRPSTSPQ